MREGFVTVDFLLVWVELRSDRSVMMAGGAYSEIMKRIRDTTLNTVKRTRMRNTG